MTTMTLHERSGRGLGTGPGRRLTLVVLTVAGLTTLAPLRTAGLPWVTRAVEFAAATLVWEVAVIATRAALERTDVARHLPKTAGLALLAVVASLPASTVIALALTGAGERIGSLNLFYGQSLVLGLVVAFARRGLQPAPGCVAERALDRPYTKLCEPDPGSSFLRNRAPRLAGGRLLALEADDHYLRVHTDQGSELILMRMRDAVDELGRAGGWQPHRSYWLAADAGGTAVRRGQAWQIVMSDGLVVPVSKTATEKMRKAGYAR